jgi:hypothetical protein
MVSEKSICPNERVGQSRGRLKIWVGWRGPFHARASGPCSLKGGSRCSLASLVAASASSVLMAKTAISILRRIERSRPAIRAGSPLRAVKNMPAIFDHFIGFVGHNQLPLFLSNSDLD